LEGNKRLTEDYIKQTLNMDIDTFVEKLLNNEIDLDSIPKIKKIFRLKPPSGGYPRGGIKVPYNQGGAYGYYGKDINILLKKKVPTAQATIIDIRVIVKLYQSFLRLSLNAQL